MTGRKVVVGPHLSTHASLGRLLDLLEAAFPGLVVAASAAQSRTSSHDHILALSGDQFVPLPPLPSLARGFFRERSCRRAIREVESRTDVVIVQLPFPCPAALIAPCRPRLYHVVGDVREMAAVHSSYAGCQRIPALLAGRWIDRFQRGLIRARQAGVVTNGDALLKRYGARNGRAIVSSTIYEHEVQSVGRRRPRGAPFRILFVGYLRPEKGIDVLVEGFRLVLERLPDAELAIVGAKPIVERGVLDALRRDLVELRRKGKVFDLGEVPFGPDLFKCFADADVVVVPSRSEGTPRVIVEAWAFGCPVVASRVGGIPTSVEDGVSGLLVPPDHPEALAEAIVRVATDTCLRAHLVEEGIARARRTTVEVFANALVEGTLSLLSRLPAEADFRG